MALKIPSVVQEAEPLNVPSVAREALTIPSAVHGETSVLEEIGKGLPRAFRFIPNVIGALLGEDNEEMREGPSLRGFLKESEPLIEARPETFPQAVAGAISEDVTRQVSTFMLVGGKKGRAAILPILSVGSGILKYRDLRDEGVPPLKAAGFGALNTIIEYGTEVAPLAALFSKELGGVRRWAWHTFTDIIGEEVAGGSELALDALAKGEALPTAKKFADNAAMIGAVAFGSGSTMSLAANAGHAYLDAKKEKVKSAIEAELAIAVDRAVGKPVPMLKEKLEPGDVKEAAAEGATIEGKVEAEQEIEADRRSLEEPAPVPLNENEKANMKLSEPAKLERAFREVLDRPKVLANATKEFKKLVKEGVITEREDTDIGKVKAKISFPHTLAKSNPKFAPVYERANMFLRERETNLAEFAQSINNYINLGPKSQVKVDTIKKMERIDRRNTAFEPGVLQQVLTQEELAGYNAFTDTMKQGAQRIADHLAIMGTPQEKIDNLMDKFSPETYFPMSRDGDFYTVAKDATGEVVHYEHHRSKKAQKSRAAELAKKHPKQVFTGKVKQTSDEVIKGIPINLLNLIAGFDKNDKAASDLDKGIGIELPKVYSELLAKGFPLHLITSKNTPGYQQDLRKPVARYLESLSTWIARREARQDLSQLLTKIDSTKEANLFTEARKYIDYVTGSSNEMAGFRKFMFMYYIGANFKSALVNSMQTISTGWPVASKYTNWSGVKLAKYAALSTKPLSVIEKQDPKLAEALKHGIFDGVLDAQHVNVLRGQGKKRLLPNKLEELSTYMFSNVERFNRKIMFTAMYKEATTKGVKVDGKKRVMSHDEAIRFAENVVDESHWNLTKADRPPITRGMAAPAFTFRLFMGNYMSLMKTLLGDREFAALARLMGAAFALGGLSAVPFAKDIEKILEKMGYDPRTSIKELAGKWGDLLLHGLGFPTGVDLSGSVSAVETVPSDIDQGTWPAVAGVILGVPTDLYDRIQRAIHFSKDLGDPYRAVETLMPEAVRNPMVAYRWYSEGARTPRGEPIANVKIKDMLLKMVAVQPAIVTKGYEREHAERLLSERALSNSRNFSLKLAREIFNENPEGLRALISEATEHNIKMGEKGNITELIIPNRQAAKRALSLMLSPMEEELKRMPKRAREEFLRIQGIHNQRQIGD